VAAVRRRIAVAGGIALVLLLIATAVASWLLASLLIVPKHDLTGEDVEVEAVRADAIVLERTEATERPGIYGIEWSGGHARIGAIVARDDSSVTRRLSGIEGTPKAGTKVGIDPQVYVGDPRSAHGLAFRDVPVPDPLGAMPAWLVDAKRPRDTWAIFVHGIDGTRQDGLRVLPALHAAGLPTMLISYRNDPGAPKSKDGLIHMGQTEWEDLDAAARWALANGARDLVLVGQSMGGAIVTRFMRESRLADRVRTLVLDAPALDWRSILDAKASELHVPFLAWPVRTTISLRNGFDWSSMDEIAHAHEFRLPILLFQGLADDIVPPADSEQFARRLPELVTYVPVPDAGHIESWNVDPTAYDRRLTAFLAAHL
jgi:uncharacterized protein